MNKAALALMFVCLVGGYQAWVQREQFQPAGILVPQEPNQKNFSQPGRPIRIKKVVLDPLASFSLEARVLSTKRYWFDKLAPIIPVDVALGWGVMSDTSVLSKLNIWQEDRFYFFSFRNPAPADPRLMGNSSANMHLIPADESVANQIKSLRKGQLIHLQGSLVRINFPDGSDAKSSMIRTDSGPGACEIVLVQQLQIF
jgi:hypothetical protein